ncbi:MAG: DUF5317 family protein [Dehalococcoidia bacterium]|nr:DUF5317 family protein [Dehalococcoidia bacterium]
MVLAFSVILSFLIALARGGKVSAIKGLRFRGLYLLAVAILLRILLIVPALQPMLVSPVIGELRLGGLTYILSLLFALAALLANIRLPGFKVVTLGMLGNFLVIAANLGQMPGAPDQLVAAGYPTPPPGNWSNFTVIGPGTPLWFLADNILINLPWPHPSVLSIGDFCIAIGVFWFFQRALVRLGNEASGRYQQSP